MRMYDLIMKKRRGEALSGEELQYMIDGYMADRIPDYQMSAFLMAVYFKGLSSEETLAMTLAVAHSGDMLDLSAVQGVKIDKHSTGGVGDKTTLVAAPIAAACGVKVAKLSGRGLGHTGGTADKLEAIPGMRLSLDREEFLRIVNKTGLSLITQSGRLAPADKRLYALRDVTATVDSLPLIAVSIMSKKLAAGNDGILLDVKTGSGAFMKTVEEAVALAREMVSIGEGAGKRTAALITDMDVPLGCSIGNSLEVIEAIDTLRGRGPKDLTRLCLALAAQMLLLAGKGGEEECEERAKEALRDGSALEKLAEMVRAQGGDERVVFDTARFKKAPCRAEIFAKEEGYIAHMDAEGLGIASAMLGAGRETKESGIDHFAGIVLDKKTGERVRAGERMAVLYASDESLFEGAKERYRASVSVGRKKPKERPLIYARVGPEGTKWL